MPKLPRITGETACKAFAKDGFELDRIRGSHHILKHPTKPLHLSIPVHNREIVSLGVLKVQIANAELTVDEFIELLKF